MKNKLVIIGAGGHGRVAAGVAEDMGIFEEIAFVDDAEIEEDFLAYPMLGKVKDAAKYADTHQIFVAIGNSKLRQKIMTELDASFATLVHPSAILGYDISIGEGTIVMPGAIVNTGTEIGDGVILNTACSVDHDCMVEDFAHVAVGAHLCGTVNVGERTWIGAGATVSNNIDICEDVMLGAGTVVIKDIEESGTYVGVPARRIK